MSFDDLYSKVLSSALDRDGPAENPAKILVCTTPRTAGHTYCQVLQQVGLGIPTEYFQWQYALPLMQRWSSDRTISRERLDREAADYGRHLLAKRSVGGVFAAKLFHQNLDFANRSIGPDDANSYYVFLFRRNKVEQTVSLLSVLYTGQPFDSDGVLPGIPTLKTISEKAVRDIVLHIASREASWRSYLAIIDPRRVAYVECEDFVASPYENARATMRNWFPTLELDASAAATGSRYRNDIAMKTIIVRQFGGLIRELWRDMPVETDQRPSAS